MTRLSLPRATALAVVVFSSTLGAQQWQQASPTVSPSARNSHAMAFDVARGVHVMFGGYAGDTNPPLGDTWEWNGTDWTQRAPAVSPPPRWGHHLAYDSRRMRVVLFGGYVPNGPVGVFANDTWEYDGTTWTQRVVATRPAGRGYGAMAYDSARGVTVLFGGYDWPSTYFGDTWEWDGGTWTQRTLPTAPSGRRGTAMAFDSARGQLVAFGGGDATALSGETWTYDGTTWTLRAPAAAPGARWEGRMAFDTLRGKALLHGGADSGYTTDYGDSWEWDGANWAPVAGAGPSARHGSAMAFDARKGQAVLFGGRDAGGFLSATWRSNQVVLTVQDDFSAPSISTSTWQTVTTGIPQGNSAVYAQNGKCVLENRGYLASVAAFDVSTTTYRIESDWRCTDNNDIISLWVRCDPLPTGYYGVPNRGIQCYAWINAQPWGVTTSDPGAQLGTSMVLGTNFLPAPNTDYHIVVEDRGYAIYLSATGGGNHVEIITPVLTHQNSNSKIVFHNREQTAGFHRALLDNVNVRVGNTAPATIATYGVGCAHSTGTPALGALNNSTPRLGQALNLRMTGLPTAPFFTPLGFVGFGNSTALGLPLPFSMGLYGLPPQCQQYVEPDPALLFTLVNAGGYADWSLALPNNPQLIGQAFFTQGLVFDWTLPYPLPAVSTNAAIATIGL